MANIEYIVFICFAIPFALALPLMSRRARPVIAFILIGMCACIFVSEVNGLVRGAVDSSLYYITTNLTPVTEEIVKALPLFIFAYFFSSKREIILPVAFACGLGFALLENSTILVKTVVDSGNVDIAWALIRTLGAGLLHGICTTMVAIGISLINDIKKIMIPGTIALMEVAIIYHSIYNSLIQSSYKYIGAVMPMATYIVFMIVMARRRYARIHRKNSRKKTGAKNKQRIEASSE